MKKCVNRMLKGVTLIETLLVLVVIGTLLSLSLNYTVQRAQQARFDKTSSDMQLILNAAMTYQTDNGVWPPSLACLQGPSASTCPVPYLSASLKNSWGNTYTTYVKDVTSNGPFFVQTPIRASTTAQVTAFAKVIAGTLPSGTVSNALALSGSTGPIPLGAGLNCTSATACYVSASVNTPQTSPRDDTGLLKFAGLYHHGGCVPVPTCTNSAAIPQIYVSVVQATGLYGSTVNQVVPITSIGAYATGGVSGQPIGAVTKCLTDLPVGTAACSADASGVTAAKYWRVCANVTVANLSNPINNGMATNWGQQQTLMAVTRCSLPSGESSGSPFTTFTP